MTRRGEANQRFISPQFDQRAPMLLDPDPGQGSEVLCQPGSGFVPVFCGVPGVTPNIDDEEGQEGAVRLCHRRLPYLSAA